MYTVYNTVRAARAAPSETTAIEQRIRTIELQLTDLQGRISRAPTALARAAVSGLYPFPQPPVVVKTPLTRNARGYAAGSAATNPPPPEADSSKMI